ncbi:MAG: hypothetical protein OEM29_03160 [Thermoplasmata archaeon]|nr:hypothetical protein [Thermoplasmata archaeon]
MSETSIGSLYTMIIVCFSLTSLGSITSLEDSVNSGWGTAAPIGSDDSGSALYPQVAVDDSGNAMVVWQQYDGVRNNIWSNRFTVEAGWGEAALLETNNSGDAVKPQIAVDNSGNATAVWQQDNGTRYCIYSNRYVVGTGWGSAKLIESNDSEGAFNPQIAVDDSGNATVVWEQDDGIYDDSIHSNRYTVGTGWGSATLIGGTANYYWDEHAVDPKVAVDGSGNAMAVWMQYGFNWGSVWSNRYEAGTGWGTASLIETGTCVLLAAEPEVAVDDSGNAISVWSGADNFRHCILSSRYVVGMGWGDPTLVEVADTGDNFFPHIAADASGNAMVVWQQREEPFPGIAESGVMANRYVAGTGWQTATIVEECSSGMIGHPGVAVNEWGNAMAVWERIDGNRTSICSSRYGFETGWGPSVSIGTSAPLNAGNPQVAIDDSGNAMVVWWQYDGTSFDIWSNRYVEPETSLSSSHTSIVTVFAILAVGVSIAAISFYWIRKKKGDRSGELTEEKPPPRS